MTQGWQQPWLCALCPVPCLSLWEGHTAAASSAFFAAGGQSYTSRRQYFLCFSLFYEEAHPSCLIHWGHKGTWSLLLLLSLYLLLGEPSCTLFKSLILCGAEWFYYIGKPCLIQDVHVVSKVRLTSIERIISDLKVCLRTLLR